MRRPALLVFLAGALAGCGAGEEAGDDGGAADAGPPDARPPDTFNATLVEALPEATWPAGKRDDGTVIIPGGRALTPVGTQLPIGGFLLGMRLLPGGRHLLLSDAAITDESLSLVDLGTRKVVQQEAFKGRKSLFLGLAVRADGHVFVSGGGSDALIEYSYDKDAVAPLLREREHAFPPGSYLAGVAFADDKRLLIAMQTTASVMLYDTVQKTEVARVAFPADQPYDIVVDPARQEAYVSLWGSREVAVLSLAGGGLALAARVETGKNPEGMLLYPPAAPTKLLVANSDSDTVTVVDLDRREAETQIDLEPEGRPEQGTVPSSLALSADGERLFVAKSGQNAVQVLRAGAWTPMGMIPTAWYPTTMLALPDGTLAVTSAKGLGAQAYAGGGGDNTRLSGILALVPPRSEADLVADATQVEANNLRAQRVGPQVACPATGVCSFPLPPRPGLPTPIEHVVLIQRENKTYDACLGDVAGTNADAKLAMFGQKYTPNLHKLALGYLNSDNFYSDAEASIQGHHWTTGGAITDYVEKTWLTTWGRGSRDVTVQSRPVTAPEQGYYWQHLSRHGVKYLSFGEIVGARGGRPDDAPIKIDAGWPGGFYFNLNTKDVEKAKYFQAWIDDGNSLPQFTYILLPNNHTYGLDAGQWTPEYMVSDNDEGTGRVVDTLTHSKFWPRTAIFIIEDDPADGYDHVEAHRSTLVVVSPWVRHGVSSTHYDYASMWVTIEHLLGVPPLSQNTAVASPMYDLFTTTPDYTPYTFEVGQIPEAKNPARAKPASKLEQNMDFSRVDDAPGLGKVLWRHMKGTEPPWELPWDPQGGDDDDD